MAGQVTRGKIVPQKGTLKDKAIDFMFNPTQYVIGKSNKWELKGNKSGNVPNWVFGGGEPRTMELELFFDASLPGGNVRPEDVRRRTNQLFKLMMIDPKLKNKNKNSKMGEPPPVQVFWGKGTNDYFECYIKSCKITYEMFNADGLPIRAKANLSLQEVKDPENLEGTNPTSGGDPGRRVRIVQEGDRLDWIAYDEYGDPNQWRRIAEANGIVDPLDLTPGMALAIPQ